MLCAVAGIGNEAYTVLTILIKFLYASLRLNTIKNDCRNRDGSRQCLCPYFFFVPARAFRKMLFPKKKKNNLNCKRIKEGNE